MLHLGPDNALILLSTEHGKYHGSDFFFLFCHLANKITLFALRLRSEDLWQRKCCRSVLSRGRYETVSGAKSPSDISTHGRKKQGRTGEEMGHVYGFNKAVVCLWGALENCDWPVPCLRGKACTVTPHLVQLSALLRNSMSFGKAVLFSRGRHGRIRQVLV